MPIVMNGQPIETDEEGYLASRDRVSGSADLIMLLVFTAMPWLRRRRSFSRR